MPFYVVDPRPPEGFATGGEERNYLRFPLGYNSRPFDLPIIPRSEWWDRWQEQEKEKSSLSHLRDRHNIPSTNQGQTNYCWIHSSTAGVMLVRVRQGQPHVPLSATSVGAKIKNFRNVGGWGAEGLERIASDGICTLADWPEGPEGLKRHYDSPIVWEKAERFKVTEWMDLEPRNLDQLVTCLLLGIPVTSDFNWWGHSVCSVWFRFADWRNLKGFEDQIWNSWSDSWGDNGMGMLQGNKAFPDGMIAPRVMVAA